MSRECHMTLIIRWGRSSLGGAGLEWLSLSYLLYSLVLALGMLVSLPYWLYQIVRHGKYRTRICRAHGKGSCAADQLDRFAARASDLGSRRFCR